MASQTDINNEITNISEVWGNPSARNGLYGNLLKSILVKGVRGIEANLEFSWPVTAIAGTNGSGKTTILQLCSAAYVKLSGGRNYRIGDWVRIALRDETPAFGDGSKVSFSFWNDVPGISIPYRKDRTRWDYPRRNTPERSVQFIGISTFAPRIERKDRLHVFRSQIEVKGSAPFDSDLITSMSKVLGIPYDSGAMHTVGPERGSWRDRIPLVKRGDCGYAEPHMGAGEQKVIRIMQALEILPKKSLVLLEEPEITLHPDAQRGLAWYLMNIARRKGHQIILTTHSSELFETLPEQARILLSRRKSGVDVIARAPYIAAARELAGVAKTNKDLILVEDIVAKHFLTDILVRYDRSLLNNTCIVPVGNTHDVLQLVRKFREEGVRAIGVRDPDIGDDSSDNVFSLPGDLAPEQLLLANENIVSSESKFSGVEDAFNRAKVAGLDLSGSKWAKKVFPALANEMEIEVSKLRDRLTDTWLNNNDEQAKLLVTRIKKALERLL